MSLFTKLLTISAFAAVSLHATVTYTYTSTPFTDFVGSTGDTTSNAVSASMTLASALPANFGLASVTPISWSFTDGVHSVDSTEANIQSAFSFATDGTGAFTSWFAAGALNGGFGLYADKPMTGFQIDGNTYTADNAYRDITTFTTLAYNQTPGTWSLAAPVPEPSTYGLALLGVAGILLRARKRNTAQHQRN